MHIKLRLLSIPNTVLKRQKLKKCNNLLLQTLKEVERRKKLLFDLRNALRLAIIS